MKLFNIKKLKDKKNGFTLIETLMAVLIFSMSIMAVVFVISDDIADIEYAKKKMTASYLAEEGIEYMRNLRDAYTLYDAGGGQTGWNSYRVKIDPCNITSVPSRSCYYSYPNLFSQGNMKNTNVLSCVGNCPTLYKSSLGGYEYNVPGAVDGYKREIKTKELNANEIEISSTIYWYHGVDSFHITFNTILSNWKE